MELVFKCANGGGLKATLFITALLANPDNFRLSSLFAC